MKSVFEGTFRKKNKMENKKEPLMAASRIHIYFFYINLHGRFSRIRF